MNIDKIPAYILKDLRLLCTDAEIKGCSAEYLFSEYVKGHGFGDYGEEFVIALDNLRECDK